MILAVVTFSQLFSKASASSFTVPEGLYSTSGPVTGPWMALAFSPNNEVRFKLTANHTDRSNSQYPGDENILTSRPYLFSMVSSSVLSVSSEVSRFIYWHIIYPDNYDMPSLQFFFYDAIKNRITLSDSNRHTFVHDSDPESDPSSVAEVRNPDGVYRALNGGASITMEFNGGRAIYRLNIDGVSHSSPFDVDFEMRSSSLIRVLLPRSQLDKLHSKFPGLSMDHFYMNLGYDAVRDEITFLPESRQPLILSPGPVEPRLPLGVYSPRKMSAGNVYAELEFLKDSTVMYKIYYPGAIRCRESGPFPASLVSSSVVSVIVPEVDLSHWRLDHGPAAFEDSGLQIFFYDAVRNRITVNGIGHTFENLHSPHPAEDAGSVADVRKPDSVYRASDGGIDITMKFANGRVTYNFQVGDVSYSFLFDVDFQMMSSSLIRVWVPRMQLYGLHGRFPGLSLDYFYMNLGYDPTCDEITFLLESWRAVILRPAALTSPAPASIITKSTTTTSTTNKSTGGVFSHRPFGDYCIDTGTAKMSLSFKDQYTVTFAAVYRDTHLLARGARYDVIKESGQVVISVDAVNSDLNDELRKMDWHGITRLKFVFDPVRNVVMLEERGLIAHMFIGIDCAAAIEAPPAEPHADDGGDDSSETQFEDLRDFIELVLEQLLPTMSL